MTTPSEFLTIVQGATTSILASDIRIDDVVINLSNWTVTAALRTDNPDGAVIAEWSTTPLAGQGQVVTGNGTCELKITPALSEGWVWTHGLIHAFATEPSGELRVARIIARPVLLDRQVLPA